MQETGAREFHGSLRKSSPNPMTFANPEVLDFGNVYLPDMDELKKIISILQ